MKNLENFSCFPWPKMCFWQLLQTWLFISASSLSKKNLAVVHCNFHSIITQFSTNATYYFHKISVNTHSIIMQFSPVFKLHEHAILDQFSCNYHPILMQLSPNSHLILMQLSPNSHTIITQFSPNVHAIITHLLSGVPDFFDRNKILKGLWSVPLSSASLY